MVNVLQSNKNMDNMYTYEVHNQIKDPKKGHLGSYMKITKVKNSHYNESPSFLYETLEEIREDFYNPYCSQKCKTAEKL